MKRSLALPCVEGHGESEPRSVAALKTGGHGIAVLLQRATARHHVLSPKASQQSATAGGLLVSQWHSLPQGTGTSLAACWEQSSLSVRCEAVLLLPLVLQSTVARTSDMSTMT